MSKNEFLHTLCEKLKEELTVAQIEEHARYYDDYINQEVRAGKSEAEVIASLGDPNLLARTILETQSDGIYSGMAQEATSGTIYQEADEGQRQNSVFRFTSMSRWGCLAVALGGLLVLGVILWFVGVVFKALLPAAMPILLILFIVALLKQRH